MNSVTIGHSSVLENNYKETSSNMPNSRRKSILSRHRSNQQQGFGENEYQEDGIQHQNTFQIHGGNPTPLLESAFDHLVISKSNTDGSRSL